MIGYTDAQIERMFRLRFQMANGYDPMDPEDTVDMGEDLFDPEWDGWIKESERGE